jgi:hypothetical protein
VGLIAVRRPPIWRRWCAAACRPSQGAVRGRRRARADLLAEDAPDHPAAGLKLSIPGIVNTFIGLFKDTTLVLIIGLFDLLGLTKTR